MQGNIRLAAKTCFRLLLHQFKGIRLARAMNSAPRILVYHQFPNTPEAVASLDRQCGYIKRYYKPVSMDEMASGLAGGSLPKRTLAITVDDGYRDFLDVAYPVFRAHRIPVMVYLISDFLDGQWMWWDRVAFLLKNKTGTVISEMTERAKQMPNAERLQFLDELQRQAQVTLPSSRPSFASSMTWEEVRRLQSEGVLFGAHTKSHPILARVETVRELQIEINVSRQRIQEELGTEVKHFCYPNGFQTDFDSRCVRILSESGFLTAVSSMGGANFRDANFLALRRTGVEVAMPAPYFQELLAGLHDPPHPRRPVVVNDFQTGGSEARGASASAASFA